MSSRNPPVAPALLGFSVQGTARALRREIVRHNFTVALIALFTLVVAAGLWTVLYAVCAWVLLFGFVAAGSSREMLPHGFTILFAVAAVCAICYAWIDRRLTPDDLPPDDKSAGHIAGDFVLALPRITISVWGTLSAALWLTEGERDEAAAFLHRLNRERRIPLHGVPLDTANPQGRFRILFALQLLRVIDIRRDEREAIIGLSAVRPRTPGLP